ncbi:hypothetical protein CDAR_403281 [Caerostris darwini]|uniref:Uncharacterized protein n=1 Tax=Caerostris darwini TaxID=1538125 RepID=A0AAV4SAX9_9ARAC|nr:hypothetical protein CDAR_403281 [Caerostris darwini]
MEKENSDEIVEREDPEAQTGPETNIRKMRLGTHRYRNFKNSPRSERVPATIGWRRRFLQVVSNVIFEWELLSGQWDVSVWNPIGVTEGGNRSA